MEVASLFQMALGNAYWDKKELFDGKIWYKKYRGWDCPFIAKIKSIPELENIMVNCRRGSRNPATHEGLIGCPNFTSKSIKMQKIGVSKQILFSALYLPLNREQLFWIC